MLRLTEVIDEIGVGLREEELPSPKEGPLDLRDFFGKDRRNFPFELEIGPGKGAFLIQSAGRFPEINYLSLEWSEKYWKIVVKRCNDCKFYNVRIVKINARNFINSYIKESIFRQIHIYFPDPWPKKKHHKRRLLRDEFFKELYHVLEPGGFINIVTDYYDYYIWIKRHTHRVSDFFEILPFAKPLSVDEDELVGTHFERKYRKSGREFYGISLKKIT